MSVFLRHGARLGATTWATAEGKPEIQWVYREHKVWAWLWLWVQSMILNMGFYSDLLYSMCCSKFYKAYLGLCCWTKFWRMGIVSTERVGSRRQNSVIDVAFGRYSSSHSSHPFLKGNPKVFIVTFISLFLEGIQKVFIFTCTHSAQSHHLVITVHLDGPFHWYCFGLRFLST